MYYVLCYILLDYTVLYYVVLYDMRLCYIVLEDQGPSGPRN